MLFWCLFPELHSNEGNKHQNNTRVSALTVRHKSTHIILFLTRHNESINDAKKEDLHTSSPCLTRSLYVLLMTSQMTHNRLAMTSQWPDNYDANTWQVISNSLDIDFIHYDIHGRSCKNIIFVQWNAFGNDVYKIAAICLGLNVLTFFIYAGFLLLLSVVSICFFFLH